MRRRRRRYRRKNKRKRRRRLHEAEGNFEDLSMRQRDALRDVRSALPGGYREFEIGSVYTSDRGTGEVAVHLRYSSSNKSVVNFTPSHLSRLSKIGAISRLTVGGHAVVVVLEP